MANAATGTVKAVSKGSEWLAKRTGKLVMAASEARFKLAAKLTASSEDAHAGLEWSRDTFEAIAHGSVAFVVATQVNTGMTPVQILKYATHQLLILGRNLTSRSTSSTANIMIDETLAGWAKMVELATEAVEIESEK